METVNCPFKNRECSHCQTVEKERACEYAFVGKPVSRPASAVCPITPPSILPISRH